MADEPSLAAPMRAVRPRPRGGLRAYGIVHHFPGGTKEQYEASIAAVHPSRDRLPDGQIFHAAGPSEGGWTIMAVHESQESWETFRDTSCCRGCSKASRAASRRLPRRLRSPSTR